MNYKRYFTTIFLAAIGIQQAACLPLNFAQSPKNPANQAIESRRAEEIAANQTSRNEAEKSRTAETLKVSATPKPKPKAQMLTDNFVCPEPNLPCDHKDRQFADWELSFRLPAKIVANREYKSAPFYAVILKKYEEGCEELDENPAVEPERRKIQKLFPSRKVFAEYSCPNMDAVNYDFSGKMSADGERFLYMDYIAVYAGIDETEGKEIFDLLKKDYPQAELKRMTANYTLIEQ